MCQFYIEIIVSEISLDEHKTVLTHGRFFVLRNAEGNAAACDASSTTMHSSSPASRAPAKKALRSRDAPLDMGGIGSRSRARRSKKR